MRRFMLTLDTLDIIFLVYSNFCTKNQINKDRTQIDAFEQKHAYYTTLIIIVIH